MFLKGFARTGIRDNFVSDTTGLVYQYSDFFAFTNNLRFSGV